MGVEAIKCPACGAPLSLQGNEGMVKCAYCLSSVRVTQRCATPHTSLTDAATGIALGSVTLPAGYRAQGALSAGQSYTFPLGVQISAGDGRSAALSYSIGEAFCDRSKCPLLSSVYAQGSEQVAHTVYKEFMEAPQYADAYMARFAKSAGASALRFVEERPLPLYEPFDHAAALADYKQRVEFEKQRSGNADMAKDTGFYLRGLCRVYELTVNGTSQRAALLTVLQGWKYQLMVGGMGALSGGLSALGEALGGALRGQTQGAVPKEGTLTRALFGNSPLGRAIAGRTQQQPPQPQQQQQPQQPQQPRPAESFAAMPLNSVIEWGSNGLFVLQSTPEAFEGAFRGAFSDFCSTLRLDEGLRARIYDRQTQILQDIARHGEQQQAQLQRQFQSYQQVHATQQAAFDSYNRAWWARTNASDAARRASYRSQVARDDSRAKFSEAIRGVNTYVREDGSEVEVSVDYDRAYTNHSGDTLGSNSAFEPGGNWTEMHRKW